MVPQVIEPGYDVISTWGMVAGSRTGSLGDEGRTRPIAKLPSAEVTMGRDRLVLDVKAWRAVSLAECKEIA